MKAILAVLSALLLSGWTGCSAVEAQEKPVLVASSPDQSVTLELYAKPCISNAAKEIMQMVVATAPITVSTDWKKVIWIGHKEGKNYDGCWVEIPERQAILFTFEDGDVKVFRRDDFQSPQKTGVERFKRQHGIKTI